MKNKKALAPKPSTGSKLENASKKLKNARQIKTEHTDKEKIGHGLPDTHYANSRDIDTEHSR